MTLFNAPSAILSHLDMKFLVEDHTSNITEEVDPSVKLELVPILFTSNSNYCKSIASFLDSVETGDDSVQTSDIDFEIDGSCIVQQNRSGEFSFCKAVKVDALLSDKDCKKNAHKTISLIGLFQGFRKDF